MVESRNRYFLKVCFDLFNLRENGGENFQKLLIFKLKGAYKYLRKYAYDRCHFSITL